MIILCLKNNKKGQATTELAVMGSVMLMIMLFLVQQAFMYKARQGIEMYTFRQALMMSRNTGRGIDLTVTRDVVTPSLFAGLSRERLQASASIEANPWDLYTAPATSSDNAPNDIPTYQLLQIGEAMIQNGHFIQIPLTKIKVVTDNDKNDDDWSWKTSSMREFDAQKLNAYDPQLESARASGYENIRIRQENRTGNYASDILTTQDRSNIKVTFQTPDEIARDYVKNDWENIIKTESNVQVDASTIPKDSVIILDENLRRARTTETPQE